MKYNSEARVDTYQAWQQVAENPYQQRLFYRGPAQIGSRAVGL